VNLSARQFADARLAETVARTLEASGAPAHLLDPRPVLRDRAALGARRRGRRPAAAGAGTTGCASAGAAGAA